MHSASIHVYIGKHFFHIVFTSIGGFARIMFYSYFRMMGVIGEMGAFNRTKCVLYCDLISSEKCCINIVLLGGGKINDDPHRLQISRWCELKQTLYNLSKRLMMVSLCWFWFESHQQTHHHKSCPINLAQPIHLYFFICGYLTVQKTINIY